MRIEKTLHGTLSRAQHAAGAAEPALGFGPEVPSSGVPSSESQTRAAREPPTRNTYPHEFPLRHEELLLTQETLTIRLYVFLTTVALL